MTKPSNYARGRFAGFRQGVKAERNHVLCCHALHVTMGTERGKIIEFSGPPCRVVDPATLDIEALERSHGWAIREP
jgi:hypothetical protein